MTSSPAPDQAPATTNPSSAPPTMPQPTDDLPHPVTTLAAAMAERPVVLDGGLATQLESQGHDLSSALWSARLLAGDPQAVTDAHREFFAAGAEVAITASYQASFAGFAAIGIERAEAEALMRRSVEVARVAAGEASDRPRWVAASVGPYGAALADGSEYRGDYGLTVAELRAWHRPRLAVLADAGADLLACETIPCLAEAEALLAELAGTGVPCWLSMTAVGERTRAGEPLAEAYAMAADVAEVVAVGVNCVDPAMVTEQVRIAAGRGKPVVVYPNSGEVWDPAGRRWRGRSRIDAAGATAWVHAGARLFGGCCRVTPAMIKQLSRRNE